MNNDRAIAAILGVSIAVVLLLGIWLLRRSHREVEPPATPTAATVASPTPQVTAKPTGGVPDAARGYRLAGTVVGDLSYAIVVDPQGHNQLYRPGQSIPNLGVVTSIEADRIGVDGGDGTFALQLAPGPTDTVTPPRSATAIVATPEPPPRRARSRFESSP